MRILLINNQHHSKGGAHAVYLNTAELLKKHGHEVFFFAQKDEKVLSYEYADYFPAGKDYRKLSLVSKINSIEKFVYNKEAYHKIKEYINVIKPDIAHVHLFMGGLTVSILKALKENNIPVVHTVHDYRLICPAYLFLNGKNQLCDKCKKNKYYNCIKNKCSENKLSQSTILALDSYNRLLFYKPQNYIDRYIFVSDFAKKKHIEFEYDTKSKMSRVYNFMPNIDEIKPQKAKGDYMLYLGRLSREKGVSTLIEAQKKMNFKLKVAGTGPLLENYQTNEDENVQFLGFQSGENLINLIQRASFIIVPSEWYENNPMSIIESYAYGKPVIGANIGGIPEIVQNNQTGFLFESGNVDSLREAIKKAIDLGFEDYEQMAINARNFAVENFSPQIHYSSLIQLYEQTIKIKCKSK